MAAAAIAAMPALGEERRRQHEQAGSWVQVARSPGSECLCVCREDRVA